jgi:hypothetical protein
MARLIALDTKGDTRIEQSRKPPKARLQPEKVESLTHVQGQDAIQR